MWLHSTIIKNTKITVPECRYFIHQILLGVGYLHRRQIIHRDLKPGNIFLDHDVQIKLEDFGLATRFTYTKDRKQKYCGTPNYMAPEILTSHGHSYKADIWSIGCLMYTYPVPAWCRARGIRIPSPPSAKQLST